MRPRGRTASGLIGLAIAVGTAAALIGLLYYDARTPMGRSGRQAGITGWAMFLSPFFFLYGVVAAVRGFVSESSTFSKKTLLFAGVLMLVLGACRWSYTGFLTGGRPGNESSGMLGTLIFIFAGIPGFILTLVGLCAGWINED